MSVHPTQCAHTREYRTHRDSGVADCACGAIIGTDGHTVYLPPTD